MSYDKYEKRITKVHDEVMNLAQVLCCSCKLPVNYEKLAVESWIKIFDLNLRGLPNVFCPLMNRVHKVKPPLQSNKNIWSSRYEVQHDLIMSAFDDAFEKARVMTLGYLECLELLKGPIADWVEVLRTIGFYLGLALRDELEEFLKYQTASLVALSLSNVPDSPPKCVTVGRWRIADFLPTCRRVTYWLRKRCLQRRGPMDVRIAFSLYTTKRIAPAASEYFVKKSLVKNIVALVTERKNLPDTIALADQVRRTIREIYQLSITPRCSYDTAPTCADQRNKEIRNSHLRASPKHLKIPSLSACYENTRGRGGALNYLLRRSGLLAPSLHESLRHLVPQVLIGYAMRSDCFSAPVPVYGLLDDDDLTELMRPSLDGFGGPVFVRREPILEPFKVRIISKGEAVPYQRAQNYQPFLWSLLQLSEAFVLTGRPLTSEDLNNVLRFGKRSRLHCQIVSGDYASATDNLHPWLCDVALEEICLLWKIPFEDALNLKACLTGHLIDDRTANEFKMNKLTGHIDDSDLVLPSEKYAMYRQIWGQLMGSPVSFPLLCIINAAVTRYSMEQSFGKEISLNDGAFLVNGDDVIFTIPSAGYQTWVRNVTSAGLTPSIGKNYVSRRYGVINSQLYDCGLWDYPFVEVDVKPVPLVRMNLIMCGQHTTTERRQGSSLFVGEALRHGKTLEGRMNELVKGWDIENRERLLKRAYHYAKPHLAMLPCVSWTLPKCLGGLGLPATLDHKVSELHLKLASMIVCLDAKTRRELIHLEWMREPGTAFCSRTNNGLNNIYDNLSIPVVLSKSRVDEPLYGRLIRSNLGYGPDPELLEPEKVLIRWRNMVSKWIKRVNTIKWSNPSEEGGLHPMTQERALLYEQGIWTRESPVRLL